MILLKYDVVCSGITGINPRANIRCEYLDGIVLDNRRPEFTSGTPYLAAFSAPEVSALLVIPLIQHPQFTNILNSGVHVENSVVCLRPVALEGFKMIFRIQLTN